LESDNHEKQKNPGIKAQESDVASTALGRKEE
jgi:hypothetical protein